MDADQGNNAAIRYAIIGGNTQSQFSIDSLSGEVSLVKPLDYETLRSYRLVIRSQGMYRYTLWQFNTEESFFTFSYSISYTRDLIFQKRCDSVLSNMG